MAVGRRAALLSAGALVVSQHSAAWAAAPAKKEDVRNGLFKLAFDQSEKLKLGKLGWGDSEAKVLSMALTRSSAAKKLILNGNNIQDAGAAALATSLRAGAAPKLKLINLYGNQVSEEGARVLAEAREGLTVSFEQPTAKDAVGEAPPSTAKRARPSPARASQGLDVNAVRKLAFEQAETLFFSELGWGNEETQVLSQELYDATALKKLFLNGNAIQCDGATALASSIRAGAAPKLKLLNLAGNRGITELDKQALTSARSGISVTFVQLKQSSDADVYLRADQGKLTVKGVLERVEKGQLVDGSTATCTELKNIAQVDRTALDLQSKLLRNMKDPYQVEKTEGVKKALEEQLQKVDKLLVAKANKGCKDDQARLRGSSGFPLPTEVFEARQ